MEVTPHTVIYVFLEIHIAKIGTNVFAQLHLNLPPVCASSPICAQRALCRSPKQHKEDSNESLIVQMVMLYTNSMSLNPQGTEQKTSVQTGP